MFKRLQTSFDWLIFLAMCLFTTSIGGFIFYFCLPKPGLKIGEILEFKHESLTEKLTPVTIQVLNRQENGLIIVLNINNERRHPIEYGQTYSVRVTAKTRDCVYTADILSVK